MNPEAKPMPAFLISLCAGIFTLLTTFLTAQFSALQIPILNSSTAITLATIAGALTVIGSILLYENASTRKFGSLLVVGFSIISMNFLGLTLGLIGGFLGLASHETSARTA